MQETPTLLLSVDEIWIKGKNRPVYFRELKKHLLGILKRTHNDVTIQNLSQRLIVNSSKNFTSLQRLRSSSQNDCVKWIFAATAFAEA